jgi:hypothetical protein
MGSENGFVEGSVGEFPCLVPISTRICAMPSAAQPRPLSGAFVGISAAALLAGYLILGWIGIGGGIGSLDAWGIIHVVNEQLSSGVIEASRPPGHPLNEYWILPNLARLTQIGAARATLSDSGYGLYQLLGSIVCLGTFWLLLGEFALTPARRLLAMACLAFSPQFLITSSDGEEFVWGMACLFSALFLLSRLSSGTFQRPLLGWYLSIAFAVAASGFRLEYGAAALLAVFVTLLVSDQSWPHRFGLAAFAAVLLALIWSPVLLHHAVKPLYSDPHSLKTQLAVAIYKIAFHASGLGPFLIALIFLFQGRRTFQLLPSFRKNILNYWALWLAVMFFALFFLYPGKILYVLPSVALLILLGAAHAGRWTWAFFVLACMALLLVHLDCFDNRRWTGLKIQPSLWAQNLAAKPAALGPKVDAATRLASTGRHVIVANIWPWTLHWQQEHAAWTGVPEAPLRGDSWPRDYRVGPGIVASRFVLDDDSHPVDTYVAMGYDVWIAQDLYREKYMRYDLAAPTPETAVVDGVSCRIVELK